MGWLWSSGTAPAAPSNTEVTSANIATSQAPPPPPQVPPAPQADTADPELAKFFAQIQAEFSSDSNNKNSAQQSKSTSSDQTSRASPPPPTQPTTAPTKSSSSSWNFFSSTSTATSPTAPTQSDTTSTASTTTTTSPPHNPPHAQGEQQPDRLDPVSESLLPTTMSCRQAFDTAFHCNSLGGQWTSVYRAGTVRSCSEHWDNFWFCMRTRAYTGETKDEAIRDYYRQRELAKYYGPGKPKSTDVWEAREEKVAPGTAFQKKYEMPDISDEEWWQMEIEHRRKVQEELQRKEAAAQR